MSRGARKLFVRRYDPRNSARKGAQWADSSRSGITNKKCSLGLWLISYVFVCLVKTNYEMVDIYLSSFYMNTSQNLFGLEWILKILYFGKILSKLVTTGYDFENVEFWSILISDGLKFVHVW